MEHRFSRLAASQLMMTLLGLLAFHNLSSALGQQSSPPTAPSRTPSPVGPNDPRWQRPPSNESEVRFRSLTKSVDSVREEEGDDKTTELVRDFEWIHSFREAYQDPHSIVANYTRLWHDAAELTNHANHIRLNVPFPLSRVDKKQVPVQNNGAEDLAVVLADLNAVITSFLDNPVFRMAPPDDKELRVSAGRDLQAIIKLSERVNKLAKKLGK